MRKRLLPLFYLCCALCAGTIMTSCDDDGGDCPECGQSGTNSGSSTTTTTAAKADITSTLQFPEDLVKYCDITVSYYTSNGEQKTKNVTTTEIIDMSCSYTSFPTIAGFKYTIKLKDEYIADGSITKEPLDATPKLEFNYKIYSKTDNKLIKQNFISKDTKKTSIANFKTKYKTTQSNYKIITIATDGTVQTRP